MLRSQALVGTAQISKATGHFTMGFARLSRTDNVEDAESAGSGTFVTVGSVHGILTAAHVLDALPKSGNVGVILSADNPAQFQKQVINIDHTEPPVLIRGETFGPNGPDLAFLKLTDEALGWLKAKCSFYNLLKRRNDVRTRKRPAAFHTDSIVGMIHELTEPQPSDRFGVRRIKFTAIFCGVRMSALKYPKGFHLSSFQMQTAHEPGFPIPRSFAGTSGGAVWRFYITKSHDKVEVIDHRLIAVPFYQGVSSDGKPQITCHEEQDIYGRLIDDITTRWPRETGLSS